MLVASEKINKKFKNNRTLSILFLSYDRLGKLHLNKDEFIVAKKYYRKSLSIRKKLAFETGSAEDLHTLSVGYRNVGNIYLKSDQLNIAKIYYRKSLNISKKLAIETGTAQDYSHLAMNYYTISYVSPQKRTEYLNQALDIWTRLTEQYPDVSHYASFRDTVKNDLGIE